MTKETTQWVQNTNKDTPLVGYSSSSVTYNSTTTRYSGIDVTLSEFGNLPTDWGLEDKNSTAWQFNPDADTNLYAYDSASHTYDSGTDTFDGVTSGENESGTRTPTAWS